MVEVKDSEIKRLQDRIFLSEQKKTTDSISEQKNFAENMLESLDGACSDRASLKEAIKKITHLESRLEETLEKAFGLQVKLTEADAKEKSSLV